MKKLSWMQGWALCALVLSCTVAFGNSTVTVDPLAMDEVEETGAIGNPDPNRQDSTYYHPGEGRWVVVAEYDLRSYKPNASVLVGATLNFGFGPMWGNLGLLRVSQIPSDLVVTAGDYAGTNLGYLVQENGTDGTPSSFSVDVTALIKNTLPLAGESQGIAFRFDDTLGGSDPFWGGGDITSPQLVLEFATSPAGIPSAAFGNVAEDGSLSNPVYPGANICYKELDGLGGYVWHDVAEFDISPFKTFVVNKATLTFTLGPDWGAGVDMNMDIAWGAASDLQVTGADGTRWGTPYWSSYQWNCDPYGPPWEKTFSLDVTAQVQQALPGSDSTSGIFFKWYSEQARLGNARTLGFDFKAEGLPVLTLEYTNPVPTQNASFNVPACSIALDGDLTDWPAASAWSQPFVVWNVPSGQSPLTSVTRARFAWNKAANVVYVALQTNQANGGHAVVGFGKDVNHAPISADGSTQLAFDAVPGGSTVTILNEIQYYHTAYPDLTRGYVGGGTEGVQAAYQVNDGVYTYEIAIPLWTNWVSMDTQFNLNRGDVVYLYSVLENVLEGGNGTDMTYAGNPAFASSPYGLYYASTLTLTSGPGDANCDGKVDVSDLGILAANYGMTVGATWDKGDFNSDTKVDVSDLGILAANYGAGTGAALDFTTDAKAFGLIVNGSETAKSDTPVTSTLGCGSAGLPLIAGVLLAGMLLNGLKIKEL